MELLESPSNKDVSLIGNFIKERQIFYPNTLATARILCSMSQEKTCVLLLSVELFLKDCSSFDCRVNRLQTATTTTTTTTTTTARTTTTTTTTTTTPTTTTTTITTTSSGQPGFLGFCNIKHRIRTGREEKVQTDRLKSNRDSFWTICYFLALALHFNYVRPVMMKSVFSKRNRKISNLLMSELRMRYLS